MSGEVTVRWVTAAELALIICELEGRLAAERFTEAREAASAERDRRVLRTLETHPW